MSEHETTVFRVAVENVTSVWPEVSHLFVATLEGRRTHDIEDVRKMVLSGNAQLWVELKDTKIISSFVTEFANYPKGVWVRVWLGAAARETPMDTTAVSTAIAEWSVRNGCRGMEAIGRHGWLKRFPHAVVDGLVMRITYDG